MKITKKQSFQNNGPIQKNRPPCESLVDPKMKLRRDSNDHYLMISPKQENKSLPDDLNNSSCVSSNTCNTDSAIDEPQVARKTTFKQNITAEVKVYSGYYFDILKARIEQLESTLTVQDCPNPVSSASFCTNSFKRNSTTSSKCSNSNNRNNDENMMLLWPFHHPASSDTSDYGSSFYKNPIDHSVIRYQLYDNPVPLLNLPCSDSMYSEKRLPNTNDMEIIDGYLNYNFRTPDTIYSQPNPGFFSFKNRFSYDRYHDSASCSRSWKPIFTFVTTFIIIAYFITELVKNAQYTGKAIQISPFNVMVGPSSETMIHMGARFAPCMKSTLLYPSTQHMYICPTNNIQPRYATSPLFNDHHPFLSQSPFNTSSGCTLEELCGAAPNQGYRFISSLFMHSGVIQLIINLSIHIRIGMIVEKVIHPIPYAVLWIGSGVFGSIFGSLFSPQGNVISGCSVCMVGIVGYLVADTVFHWRSIKMHTEILLKLILCFVISLLVGLLPGYDNFSHTGGFLGGMIIGVCLLPFSPMKNRYQAWLIGSMAYLFLAILLWICLRLFFTPDTNYCKWCKYFACLPISNLCQPYSTNFT